MTYKVFLEIPAAAVRRPAGPLSKSPQWLTSFGRSDQAIGAGFGQPGKGKKGKQGKTRLKIRERYFKHKN